MRVYVLTIIMKDREQAVLKLSYWYKINYPLTCNYKLHVIGFYESEVFC